MTVGEFVRRIAEEVTMEGGAILATDGRHLPMSGRLRRHSARLGLGILTTMAVVGCGGSTSLTTNGGPLVAAGGTPVASADGVFHDQAFPGLTFRYPAGWHTHAARGWDGSFFSMIVFLSNQRLHAPCTVIRHGRNGRAIFCHSPLNHLAPGGSLPPGEKAVVPGGT